MSINKQHTEITSQPASIQKSNEIHQNRSNHYSGQNKRFRR